MSISHIITDAHWDAHILMGGRDTGELANMLANQEAWCRPLKTVTVIIPAVSEALELANKSGDQIYTYLAYCIMSWAEARAGKYDAAIESTTRDQAMAEELGGQVMGADYLAAANAELAFGAGQIEKAFDLLNKQ